MAIPHPTAAVDPGAAADGEGVSATYRKLFETQLRQQPSSVRAAHARLAEEPELSAFCFDPIPSVIRSAVENPRFGLSQARLVAAHHGNPAGLEAVVSRAAFAHDAQFMRCLLRNSQTPVGVLRRLWAARRLLELFKASVSREHADRHRQTLREIMRSRFSAAPAEEKVELICATEGRSILALSGLALDGRTTSLLCARQFPSALLIQNLARWSATPNPLITHLLKQPLIKRMPQLRTLLLRHPNSSASRG